MKIRWLTGTSCLFLGGVVMPAWAEEVVVFQENQLSEVSVTAARSGTQELRRNATAGKIIVDREELDALDASSMGELLSKLPGGGAFADMGGGPRGKGRGPDRNMPTILVDGQPLPGGGRNPMAALRLPVELVERVEIIRNSTPEFPVVGAGGVINLILRDVPRQWLANAKLGAGASAGKSIVRMDGQYGEPGVAGFGYLLSASFNSRPQTGSETMQAATYTNGVLDGRIHERASQSGRDDNLVFSPRFSWNLGDGQRLSLTPFLMHGESDQYSTIQRNRSGLKETERLDQEGRRTSGRLSGEWRKQAAGGTETLVRLMLQAERDASTRRNVVSGGSSSYERQKSLREERDSMLELQRKQLLGDTHLLTGAIEWRDKRSDESQVRSGNTSQETDARLSERRWVAWVQDEWQLSDRHVLTPGLRYQLLDTRVNDSKAGLLQRDHETLDPSLHYLWQVTDAWNFRASLARTTKLPSTRDLSPTVRLSNGSNSSSEPDKGGNPELQPERLRSVELGVEHFLDNRAGTIGLSFFDREIKNYTQRLIAEESGGRWVERPRNVGTAQQYGGLLDLKTKMDDWGLQGLTLRGNLAYTKTRMLDQMPGLGRGEGPRKSANLGMDYEVPAWRLTVGGNYNYISAIGRESNASLIQYQGARRQLDLYALYKFDRKLALRFSAQNVTRADRTNHLRELDASGLTSRQEEERVPGVASYLATLEIRW